MTAYTVMSLLECCKDEEKPILMVCSVLISQRTAVYLFDMLCSRKCARLFNTCRGKLELA